MSPLNAMGLPELDQLYMMSNKIKKLCQLTLPNLTRLDVNMNPIEEVD